MVCFEVTLPFPPSVNSLYGGGSKQKRFPSKKYKEWLKILPPIDEVLRGKFHIHYTFYFPDNRIRDGQSYLKATTDYLVKQGLIEDDNWHIVSSESWSHGGIDKDSPRVEIKIIPQKEFKMFENFLFSDK